ncbi:MAG: CoA transferase [Hyphomonadaceae bacterium]|jgi:crotonobetainyl-CoA:carnitine CoA-transferase CaiB-like acyl-CoA transferase|nr:CoA transferase [Hyphomonadaceae bacterium]
MSGPLSGLVVLDLSRILAGPTCTQLLGDLGADVIKVERPGQGDDTRHWGPPFVVEANGGRDRSAYFLCANRNKRSVAVDFATEDGAAIVRRLATQADVVVENYKVGGLAKYGLDYKSLSAINPRLIYCSISGFGQTGPNSHQLGYDALIQAMGGIMSLTGEPNGMPMKVGVGIADVVCGLYAANAIQAALRWRGISNQGQHIDIALYDTQVAWLINEATNYLVSDQLPRRRGTAHPNIVPYQVFETADGHVMLAVGNDGQFSRFATVAGHPEWARDDRFATNPARLAHRESLVALVAAAMRSRKTCWWVDALVAVDVPCGPVRDLAQVFSDGQCTDRGLKVTINDASAQTGTVPGIGNPIKLSATPVSYRRAPPRLGADTVDVLASTAGLSDAEIARLKQAGTIG